MSQQYSLRWNNHQPNFISMFTTLLNTQTLVDVTLSADGKQLKAHKVVLSACSTYFQALFVDNPSSHPIVILKDVSYADLRTMVDFMYYGEVNITEEQLPKMLETAKLLKIKGLTEMPESASLMRSQGTSVDFQSPGDSGDSQRHSTSPSVSPSTKRKRRRKSSTGSTCLNTIPEENRNEEPNAAGEIARCDSVTLGGLPQQRRMREYQDERNVGNAQQPMQPHNLNVDSMTMEANQANQSMPQGICNSPTGLKFRRAKHFQRQSRVQPDDRDVPKQSSVPLPTTAPRQLQKHGSYPQYQAKDRRSPTQNELGAALLIRAVTVVDQLSPTKTTSTSTSIQTVVTTSSGRTQRASHTPAVRSGPPLSCNYCWNSVDESGRILRRKTQYHCPECRTNLCIVPCFHQYHAMPQFDSAASAR